MASKANPAVIGGFVLGAVVLAVAGLVVLGGGKFFQERQRFVAYFDESVKGLAIGAPVTFQGVRVGSITDIKVVVNRETQSVRIPVFFEIRANRISETGGGEFRFVKDVADAKLAFERGLRAQLQLQSLVTGQLGINLDFHPSSPMRLVGAETTYPEFPTIPSTMAALGQSLDDLNVGELAQDIRRTVQGMERLVNAPETKRIFISADATLESVRRLAASVDTRVTTLGPALESTTATLNDTLDALRTLARTVNSQTVPVATETFKDAGQLVRRLDAETVPAANALLADTRQVARRVDAETIPAVTQLLAQVRQLAVQFETALEATRVAVQQVQKLAAAADAAVSDRQPLLYQIDATLQEVSGAARSIRALADYLERHPDALIFGKTGK